MDFRARIRSPHHQLELRRCSPFVSLIAERAVLLAIDTHANGVPLFDSANAYTQFFCGNTPLSWEQKEFLSAAAGIEPEMLETAIHAVATDIQTRLHAHSWMRHTSDRDALLRLDDEDIDSLAHLINRRLIATGLWQPTMLGSSDLHLQGLNGFLCSRLNSLHAMQWQH